MVYPAMDNRFTKLHVYFGGVSVQFTPVRHPGRAALVLDDAEISSNVVTAVSNTSTNIFLHCCRLFMIDERCHETDVGPGFGMHDKAVDVGFFWQSRAFAHVMTLSGGQLIIQDRANEEEPSSTSSSPNFVLQIHGRQLVVDVCADSFQTCNEIIAEYFGSFGGQKEEKSKESDHLRSSTFRDHADAVSDGSNESEYHDVLFTLDEDAFRPPPLRQTFQPQPRRQSSHGDDLEHLEMVEDFFGNEAYPVPIEHITDDQDWVESFPSTHASQKLSSIPTYSEDDHVRILTANDDFRMIEDHFGYTRAPPAAAESIV
jgi:hypothetical protein